MIDDCELFEVQNGINIALRKYGNLKQKCCYVCGNGIKKTLEVIG